MKTIRRRLLVWLLGGMLVSTLVAGAATYAKVREEADELFDYQLRQIAVSLPAGVSPSAALGETDPEEDFVVQVWNRRGDLIYASRPDRVLPRNPGTGFTTVSARGGAWRLFGRERHGQFVQVAQAIGARDELIFGVAMRSLAPFLALIPALGALIWMVVGQALHPLRRVAEAVRRRSADALQPLSTDGIPPEIRPMLDALNDLLGRLDRALGAQRAFVADATHELRTPLAALKLQLKLAERAESSEQRTIAFGKLHDRLDRASHLVNQLLTLARNEPQVEGVHFSPVDLSGLAANVVSDNDALAESRGIDLGVEAGAGDVTVQGHRESLRVMLDNLVDNALRYTPPGGRVDVIVSVRNGRPQLRVVDTGPGIPADERSRVFDRFFRREDSGVTGSGLGLAIVKNIADRHGAVILLHDNPPTPGLSVTVEFQG